MHRKLKIWTPDDIDLKIYYVFWLHKMFTRAQELPSRFLFVWWASVQLLVSNFRLGWKKWGNYTKKNLFIQNFSTRLFRLVSFSINSCVLRVNRGETNLTSYIVDQNKGQNVILLLELEYNTACSRPSLTK